MAIPLCQSQECPFGHMFVTWWFGLTKMHFAFTGSWFLVYMNVLSASEEKGQKARTIRGPTSYPSEGRGRREGGRKKPKPPSFLLEHWSWDLSSAKCRGDASDNQVCPLLFRHPIRVSQGEPRRGWGALVVGGVLNLDLSCSSRSFRFYWPWPRRGWVSPTLKPKSLPFLPASPPSLSDSAAVSLLPTLAVSSLVSTLWVSGLPISTWSLTGLIWCKYLQGKPWNWWTVMSSRFCTIGKR